VQVDIAETALHHLIYGSGVRPENQPAWALDGKSWLCDMGLCNDKVVAGINPVKEDMIVSVSPNPSHSGVFNVQYESYGNYLAYFIVIDMVGKVIKERQPRHRLSDQSLISALCLKGYTISL
jgi:hypothetical protein